MTNIKELFPQTKKLLNDYQDHKQTLLNEYDQLQMELENTSQQIANILLNKDAAVLSEQIQMNLDHKHLVEKLEVLGVMMETNEEKQGQLKVHYAGLLKDARKEERAILREYDANEIIDRHKAAMLNEIAAIGSQTTEQYRNLLPSILEIIDCEEVKEIHPRSYMLFQEPYLMPYEHKYIGKAIVSREDIDKARFGKGVN